MKNESTCMRSALELAPIGEYRMCQRAVRRLCNPCERCLVRKVARLLAQPLRNAATTKARSTDARTAHGQLSTLFQRVAMKMDRMASWSDESLLRRPS